MIRLMLLCFSMIYIVSTSYAAHIIGGDVTYQCISSNLVAKTTKFRVTFTIYRDGAGNGAPFDMAPRFGVFERSISSNIWSHKQTVSINPSTIENVPYEDKCVIVPPNINVQKANYIFDIELPWGEKVYQITYQRCCRNNTINNIVNPGETGAAFFVEIFGNAIQECNNSPVFNKFPPILICNQKELNFDHSASDKEGHTLTYEFCSPISAGGTDGATTPGNVTDCTGVTPLPDNCLPPFQEVVFNANYSPTNPMGGSPQISIDPNTGKITGVPNLLGQFVVGVCVKEFKNGVQIGSIRREFQFNVVNCQGISETQNADLCIGDSILIDDTYYTQPGTYTQVLQTASGCDSTLTLIIKGLKKSESQLSYKLCDEESVNVNGQSYHSTGVYTQVLTNTVGCDSTLTVRVQKSGTTESIINIQLCDSETGIVNGVVYTSSGNYSQVIDNAAGCDSIINIYVNKGISTFEERTFSLCDQNPIIINGQTYDKPGKFTNTYTSTNGCDSIQQIVLLPCDQNIVYDLEKCNALSPDNSMNYEEFIPTYSKKLDCGEVVASNIYRDNPQMNKHSCTPGYNNSIAMCVSASSSCEYEVDLVEPIVLNFTIKPENGYTIQFNHLDFQQMSPFNFNWIAGPTGANNFPTKYGIKVFKNNIEIYNKKDIPATNLWTKEEYDFFTDTEFTVVDSSEFRIELLPYCPIGNNATVSVWDIDDVGLYFSCHENSHRQISGKIMNPIPELANTQIRRKYENTQIATEIKADGSFVLPINRVDQSYSIEAYKNDNAIFGLTTMDLVITQRHILGLQPFTSALQYLAADVNGDQKVSAADLVQMRKLILGIDEQFRNNTSWIFLNEESAMSEQNPWMIQQYIQVPVGNRDINHLKFIALKVGDVDGASSILETMKDK